MTLHQSVTSCRNAIPRDAFLVINPLSLICMIRPQEKFEVLQLCCTLVVKMQTLKEYAHWF